MASRAHESLPTASSDTSTDAVVIIGTSRRSRDEDFTTCVADHQADLLRTAWLLCGDSHRAEELTQQALVRTYGAWSRAGAGDPVAYARRVLVNLRIDTWRRRRREVLVAPEDLPDDAAHPGTAPHRSTADHQADRDQLVPVGLMVGRAAVRRGTRVRGVVGQVLRSDEHLTTAPSPGVDPQVDQDPPRVGNGVARTGARPGAVGADERLLSELLGTVAVPAEQPGGSQQVGLVVRDEGGEVLVPGAPGGADDDDRVRRGIRRRRRERLVRPAGHGGHTLENAAPPPGVASERRPGDRFESDGGGDH